MEIVINIPEETLQKVKWYGLSLGPKDKENVVNAIRNGKSLPKGHGRLIDGDKLYGDFIDGTEGYDCQRWSRIEIGDIIDDEPTIIEKDKEDEK